MRWVFDSGGSLLRYLLISLIMMGGSGCKQPYSLPHFMLNPRSIEPMLAECDGLSIKERINSKACIAAEQAHNTYGELIMDATLNSAGFGQRIMDEQIKLAKFKAAYEAKPTDANSAAYHQQAFRVRVMLNAVEMAGD